MALKQTYHGKYVGGAGSILAASMLVFSPMLFPAVAAKFDSGIKPLVASFTPAGVDSRLADKYQRQINAMSSSRFPFTPAGVDAGRSRTMTVAARADSLLTANAVSVRNIIASTELGSAATARLNPSDYRLTAGRGWQGFVLPKTQKLAPQAPISDLSAGGNFRLDDGAKRPARRLNADMTLGQIREAAPSPRGNSASGDYKVDVGGSFSISRKIDVTAGVRYKSERDRLVPKSDNVQDSEAVYVGTKIRF